MNTSFDITDIDCAPKELEDALGVSGRTLFDPTEHPIHVDIWDGKGSFNTEQLEKTAAMLGMSLYQLMLKLLQPIDGINQIKP